MTKLVYSYHFCWWLSRHSPSVWPEFSAAKKSKLPFEGPVDVAGRWKDRYPFALVEFPFCCLHCTPISKHLGVDFTLRRTFEWDLLSPYNSLSFDRYTCLVTNVDFYSTYYNWITQLQISMLESLEKQSVVSEYREYKKYYSTHEYSRTCYLLLTLRVNKPNIEGSAVNNTFTNRAWTPSSQKPKPIFCKTIQHIQNTVPDLQNIVRVYNRPRQCFTLLKCTFNHICTWKQRHPLPCE